MRTVEPNEDEEAHLAWLERWESEVYGHAWQTTGAICGNIWVDERAGDGGLMPRERGGRRVTFGVWCTHWLDELGA